MKEIETLATQFLLAHQNDKPGWFSRYSDKFTPNTFKILLKLQQELDDNRIDIEKHKYEHTQKYKHKIHEFKAEMTKEELDQATQSRLKYLSEEIKSISYILKEILKSLQVLTEKKVSLEAKQFFLDVTEYEKKENYRRKLLNEFEHRTEKRDLTIDHFRIQKAREYPISELLEIDRKGFAHCINHDDKKASMYCKNNFAHCFSCGWTGDSIAIIMLQENLNFIEAVQFLTK